MASKISVMIKNGVCNPPRWLSDNIMFECKNGSFAYGVNNKDSDVDYLAYCIPPKDLVFHTDEIPGFGTQKKRFNQYQEQVIFNAEQYDITCYSIVQYFQLCMECNPNMVESLFYPQDCITFSTQLSELVRDNRKLFLHKGAYHRLKGYAYSQLSGALGVKDKQEVKAIREFEEAHNIPHNTTYEQLLDEINERESLNVTVRNDLSNDDLNHYKNLFENGMNQSKRFYNWKCYNQDNKYLYHICRLTNYARQILENGDLDVRQDREYWKAIRRGEVSVEEIQRKFEEEERNLQALYDSSKLQNKPDENKIKNLLLDCLEMHYGSVPIEKADKYKNIVDDIQLILQRNNI
jgi:predicted nucleotidyltransferase